MHPAEQGVVFVAEGWFVASGGSDVFHLGLVSVAEDAVEEGVDVLDLALQRGHSVVLVRHV